MGVPKEGTPEWDELVEKWISLDDAVEKAKLAQEYGYANTESLGARMRERGVRRVRRAIVAEEIAGQPKTIILPPEPIPKITLRKPPKQEIREEEEDQTLHVGDTHFGLKTRSYNKKVAEKRMVRLYDKCCKFADIHRKFVPVRKLHMFLGGDESQGEAIGKQLMLDELELCYHEQKTLAVKEFSNLLVNLCQWYESIDVVCVPGNHGILGKTFSFASNWSIQIYDLLQSDLKNYPQITFHIQHDDFYIYHKVRRSTFLVTHGDQIISQLGIPYYGIDRRTLRWQENLEQRFDYVAMFHFHSANYIRPSGIKIFMNGTLSTGSRFARQRLGLEEDPEMWTLFVGDKYGVTGMHLIDVARED